MPSVSKPQATLMAIAAKNPAVAKRRGIPQSVAREFHRADKRTGILKRAAGGTTPLEAGLNAKLNFGQGHGHNLFSTMPLMGHALSGTQLGQADNAIRRAQRRFADGGKVAAKPKGPSASERREIRAMIERGKGDAVGALRQTRAALLNSMPAPMERKRSANAALFQRYAALLDRLGKPDHDEADLTELLTEIESELGSGSEPPP